MIEMQSAYLSSDSTCCYVPSARHPPLYIATHYGHSHPKVKVFFKIWQALIPGPLWKPKFDYRAHRCPQLVSVLSYINPLNNCTL